MEVRSFRPGESGKDLGKRQADILTQGRLKGIRDLNYKTQKSPDPPLQIATYAITLKCESPR